VHIIIVYFLSEGIELSSLRKSIRWEIRRLWLWLSRQRSLLWSNQLRQCLRNISTWTRLSIVRSTV